MRRYSARRLQLEQRRDEQEELATHFEVELVPLGHELDEREDDRCHVDLARLELFLQQEREEEVERAFERIEVELELTHGSRRHGLRLAAPPDASGVSGETAPDRGRRRA
jgi:hypothetical protein